MFCVQAVFRYADVGCLEWFLSDAVPNLYVDVRVFAARR